MLENGVEKSTLGALTTELHRHVAGDGIRTRDIPSASRSNSSLRIKHKSIVSHPQA